MTDSRFLSDCERCFGFCCVALPYARSADFARDKAGGTSCPNLGNDYRCAIHQDLRKHGYKGCTVYECFGAGQKVSQLTYQGKSWREYPEIAGEMFAVFPVMQQLHEILYYLHEARGRREAESLQDELRIMIEETERLTQLEPAAIRRLDVPAHRAKVSPLLLQVSEQVRAHGKAGHHLRQIAGRKDLIGAKLKGADLRGAHLRGTLLIAADLREADLRWTDMIGADLRDADLRGADLRHSLFLTQAQVNAAQGDRRTQLPPHLQLPAHWMT